MQTYKLSDEQIKKKRRNLTLAFIVPSALLIFMIIDPFLFLANDPMPLGMKYGILALIAFCFVRIIMFSKIIGKKYLELNGNILTFHDVKKDVVHDLTIDKIEHHIHTTTMLYVFKLTEAESVLVKNENGRVIGTYTQDMIGKENIQRLLNDVNALGISQPE